MNSIFYKNKLKNKYFEQLVNEFWYAPCDSFLRAPEIAIWRSIQPKHPILDVGCGDGRMDKYLFPHIDIDVGIDSDKKAVGVARKSGLYDKVVHSKASKIPFENDYFSSVISNSTFEHIKDDLFTLREISRILKIKGDFIFTTTTDNFLKTMVLLGLKGQPLKTYNERVGHYHYRSVNAWKSILKNAGFEPIIVQRYFPISSMKIWWNLFRLTTLKVYKRELWSYLKDSPYGRLFPSKLISKMTYLLLVKSYKKAFDKSGNWVFVWAKKK